jgi:hypothetical protein
MSESKCIPLDDRFEIGLDRCGRWIARDREGVKAGAFFTFKDAMRFARSGTGELVRVHASTPGESNGRRRVPNPSGERAAP